MAKLEAMVPEGARPAVRAIVKHHFWILAALVPLFILPMLFAGTGSIGASIDEKQQEIDGKFSQVAQVSQLSPHPNEEWSKVIAGQAEQVQTEIDDEWQRLWESQAPLRVWPPDLGPDFLRGIGRVGTNGTLPRPLLTRYRETVPRLVQKLPERMGAPAAPLAATGTEGTLAGRMAGGGGPGMSLGPEMGPGMMAPGMGPEGAGGMFIPPKFVWNPSDQARIYQSFIWKAVPTTRQVLFAQEQLWVYGIFCDIVRDFTASATGSHDTPISVVEEIAIAQDAAEPGPGGMYDSRVFVPARPRAAASEMGMGSMESMGSMEGGGGAAFGPAGGGRRGGRGMRARAGGSGMGSGMEGMDEMGSGMPGAMGGGATPSGPPSDEELLSYAYVDFGGRPLTAAELTTEPGARMTHLMPFVLRIVIDQRSIDSFLSTLATHPVPIDVRQVRINAGRGPAGLAGGMGDGMGMEMGSMMMPGGSGMGMGMGGMSGFEGGMGSGMPGGGTAPLRRHDVSLEIRGTVGLATNPDDPLKVEASSDDGFGDDARLDRRLPPIAAVSAPVQASGRRAGAASWQRHASRADRDACLLPQAAAVADRLTPALFDRSARWTEAGAALVCGQREEMEA